MRETFNQNVVVNIDEQNCEPDGNGQTGRDFLYRRGGDQQRPQACQCSQYPGCGCAPSSRVWLCSKFEDDGIGFDVEAGEQRIRKTVKSWNGQLEGNRAELVNGLLNIQSVKGKGTKVLVYLPLSEEASDRLQNAGTALKS